MPQPSHETVAAARLKRLDALCERARYLTDDAAGGVNYPEAIAIVRALADEART